MFCLSETLRADLGSISCLRPAFQFIERRGFLVIPSVQLNPRPKDSLRGKPGEALKLCVIKVGAFSKSSEMDVENIQCQRSD